MRSLIKTSSGPSAAVEVALDRLFGVGVRPLRLEAAVFDEMLDGWARQQCSLLWREATIAPGCGLVRRVASAAERWPWEWSA